jgi:TPR repeat protein
MSNSFPSLLSAPKPGAGTLPAYAPRHKRDLPPPERSFIDPYVTGLPQKVRAIIDAANREKGPKTPYIHVVQTGADYNEGFSAVFSWLNELELSGKYIIGISDGGNKDAVRESTEAARERIGDRPFPLRIIKGHGSETAIQLGEEGPAALYTEADVDDFDGTTAFLSCHTAPLAKKMAQISKRRFLAPTGISDWRAALHYSSHDRQWHHIAPRRRTAQAFDGDVENSLIPSTDLLNELEGSQREALTVFADSGHAESQYLLGINHILSNDANLYLLGLNYLKQAADQGLMIAQLSLGLTYIRDFNNSQPPNLQVQASAHDYLKRAADQGNIESQYLLGIEYIKSTDPQVHQLGLYYLKRAADKDHLLAQFNLGVTYLIDFNDSQQQSLRCATEAIQHAVDHRYTISQDALDLLPQPNFDLRTSGRDYLQRAADQNHAEAQYTLGIHYLQDLDPQLQASGRDHLRRAIKQGHARALKAYQTLVQIPPTPTLTQPTLRRVKRKLQPNEVEVSAGKREKLKT